MIIYHGKSLQHENGTYAEFAQLFADAVIRRSPQPFLLVRPDGARMQIVAADGNLMLSVALDSDRQYVSYGSTYAEGTVQFSGLNADCEAKADNFIDASIAMAGVVAFTENKRLSDHFDMRRGIPDRDILSFPTPVAPRPHTQCITVSRTVTLCDDFQRDMASVCEFLDEVENDPDENIDFGDAIQIGSFCGGRTNPAAGTYQFSYYDKSGEVWTFDVNRTIMDSIADGGTKSLAVSATVPKAS